MFLIVPAAPSHRRWYRWPNTLNEEAIRFMKYHCRLELHSLSITYQALHESLASCPTATSNPLAVHPIDCNERVSSS